MGHRQGGSLMVHLHPQADQEMMEQHRHGGVMMPARPATDLVVIQAQLAFALFNSTLHRPAPGGELGQFFPAGGRRGISAIEFPVFDGLLRGGAQKDQPLLAIRQTLVDARDPHAGGLHLQGALTAFVNDYLAPLFRGQTLRQFVHPTGGRRLKGQLRLPRWSPHTPIRRDNYRRPAAPHPGRAGNFGKKVLVWASI